MAVKTLKGDYNIDCIRCYIIVYEFDHQLVFLNWKWIDLWRRV